VDDESLAVDLNIIKKFMKDLIVLIVQPFKKPVTRLFHDLLFYELLYRGPVQKTLAAFRLQQLW
jgi:hypothetical protein